MKSLDYTKQSLINFPGSVSATNLAGYFLVFMLTVLATGCDGSGTSSSVSTTEPVVAIAGPIVAICPNRHLYLRSDKSEDSNYYLDLLELIIHQFLRLKATIVLLPNEINLENNTVKDDSLLSFFTFPNTRICVKSTNCIVTPYFYDFISTGN